MNKSKTDIAIVGGGISSVITALKIKEYNSEARVHVFEKGGYRVKQRMYLYPPVARSMLKTLPNFKQLSYDKCKNNCYSLNLTPWNINVPMYDVNIIEYSHLLYYLLDVLKEFQGVQVDYNTVVENIDIEKKTLTTNRDELVFFDKVVVGMGTSNLPHIEKVGLPRHRIDTDLSVYDIQFPCIPRNWDSIPEDQRNQYTSVKIPQPHRDNMPKPYDGLTRVGISGGFNDFMIYSNIVMKIESAIVAGECLALGTEDKFYERMKRTRESIAYSLKLREALYLNPLSMDAVDNVELISTLQELLLYNTKTYFDVYRLITSK